MIHIVMLKLLSFVFIKKFIIRMIMIIVIIIVTCKTKEMSHYAMDHFQRLEPKTFAL